MVQADASQVCRLPGIGEVPYVPTQQVIHPMHGRYGDMQGIAGDRFGHRFLTNQQLCQATDFLSDGQEAESACELRRRLAAAETGMSQFGHDLRRDKQLVARPVLVPPLAAGITTVDAGRIAAIRNAGTDKARFQVDA